MIDTTAIFYTVLTVQNFPGFLFSSILQMSPSARIFFESTKIHLKTMFVCELMFLPPYIVGIQEGLGLTPHCLKQSSEYSFMFHEWGSNMSSTPSEQVGMTISVQAWKSKPGKILVRKWNTKSEINCPRSYSSEAKKWGFELNSLASEPLFFTPYHLSLFLRLNWEVTELGLYIPSSQTISFHIYYHTEFSKNSGGKYCYYYYCSHCTDEKMEAQIESS